jgi:hypothetical protein
MSTTALQNLPVGIQSFEYLRANNFLYVDKTEDIYRMVTTGKPYFLSRPRRFGKSLLVSTLDCLFSAKKNLFEGLYIYDQWDWTRKYPVVRFDMGGMAYRTEEALEKSLSDSLKRIARDCDTELQAQTLPGKLEELIINLHRQTGEQVVVLIDEYDKPIIDNLSDLAFADTIRKTLHDFYQVLKASDDHLRLIFLTGVSKFSKVSIFSGLNNLIDMTLDPRFSTICGYTQQELETCFAAYLDDFAQQSNITLPELLDEIRFNYNGYSWDGTHSVYNPFSTLLLLAKKQFIDYWFESGTPTFLVDLIKARNDIQPIIGPFELNANAFNAFEIANIDIKLLLFQTGYLTVKSVRKNRVSDTLSYLLDIPNEEVRIGLMTHLFAGFAESSISNTATARDNMMEQLLDGDTSAFDRNLKALIANIPYQLHVPEEKYYHSLFLLWLNMLGFKVDAEVSTNIGRIDAVWTWKERVVITEVKYAREGNPDALLAEAFAQIREKKYSERYHGQNKRIALLAVAFAGREVTCEMMELP